MKGGHGRRGSHRVWARPGAPGERHRTVTIPIGKKEIPAGTLSSIKHQLGIDEDELRRWMT